MAEANNAPNMDTLSHDDAGFYKIAPYFHAN
jgi:hypothetical protein